jgi:predicted DNA-binding transcriptional regulator AlpA
MKPIDLVGALPGKYLPPCSPWPAEDTILSNLQAAEMIGCHRATLEKLHRRGEGPPRIRISDRRFGYRLGDLRQWLQSRVSA